MGNTYGKLFKSVENVVSEAVERKATEDDENPPEECRPLDSISCDDELDVVSVAGKRKETEDHENSQKKRRRISIPCDNVGIVSVAGKRKRKETEDHENSQEKRRRLSIPCVDELPSTSGVPESRNTPEAVVDQRSADDGPVQTTQRSLDLFAKFEAKYQQQEALGKGGFGFVFAGYRKEDNLDVAIKHIARDKEILLHEDSTGKQIPMEVAIMLKLAAVSERHSAPVDLLDWYDLDQEVILVLERPMPAVDLLAHINDQGGCLKEKEAKIIMRQLVDAAIDLQQKQIFHRHIKVENLLIETGMDGIRVRVIDFGLSCFDEEGDVYDCFYGTHIPPEWHSQREYCAGPSTVYQIGAVLVDMLQNPTFRADMFYLLKRTKWWFSENCKDFLTACFRKDPEQRLTLEQLRNHLWLR